MADELNGGGGSRAYRVTFARGTQPAAEAGAQPAPEGGTATVVEIGPGDRVSVGGARLVATLSDLGPPRTLLREGATPGESAAHHVLISNLVDAARGAEGVRRLEVVVDGWRFELDVDTERRARLRERATSARTGAAKGGPAELRAIIPGRVVSVDVAEGDMVEPGRRLLVLEAMKMQNELKATRAGRVARIDVGPGQNVELGDPLLVIE